MTTARDLLVVVIDTRSGTSVEQGDLSLALAGAELLDLIDAGAADLDGDRVVPGPRQAAELAAEPATDDPLLRQAASSMIRQEPHEPVEDWLWRRGRDLVAAYLAEWGTTGSAAARWRARKPSLSIDPSALADSPARRHANDRWAAHEPVLTALAAAAGVGARYDGDPDDGPEGRDALTDLGDDRVVTVLAAVNEAVVELAGVRQRRAIETAAFDNIWRAV
ncbi:GPP34 family phosphoprotein [Streptomyces hirsutus]|uniref:GPP34 family phosphoprotein n=1 Tax=Streptomyces hirsutus TaxID=35620 RepID=A0ABZ1GZB1_9ACTN|nr:GPP34 family phosphoprotein [Streptomyces hirsutus]WSD10369.1 GPP34 family phosphoprotein [Streptomyces hirsutus]WTD16282.1 GPP34 family phosphoprotein [Streptomyces hirsutus]WTD78944.1 GPP34 family phosphoprotein [Streptomyces sp. NBC_01635]